MENHISPVFTNIFTDIPQTLPEELFECILKKNGLTIERIVSKGHSTPIGHWYDQSWNEWIILLQGQATLHSEKDREFISLTAGDYLLIPAHTRHRVEWTPPDVNTVWLAIHLDKPEDGITSPMTDFESKYA